MTKLSSKLAKVGFVLLLSSNIIQAKVYIVQKGESLNQIVKTLGFSSLKEANIDSVPSGNFNMIFPGDIIFYGESKTISDDKKLGRYAKEQRKFKHVDNVGDFCFKNNSSIHYKATQKCKK